ncbi:hypothetical protein GCM10028820_27780 [Tessaracoccus terricola]
MPAYDILGWVAAAFGMSAAIPQLIRIGRTRVSAGLSTRLWQISAGTTGAWAMHGFFVGAVQLQIPNLVCASIATGILWFIAADRKESFLRSLLLPLGLALALFGLDLLAGAVVFGLVVAVPAAFAQISQFLVMRRAADLSGISVPTLLVNVVVQALWLTWGIGVTEWAITVCASVMIILCGGNAAYYGLRRLRGTAGPVAVVDEMAPGGVEAVA